MKRALLLNSDYTPLRFISDMDAITLYYKGRAEVVVGSSGRPSEWDEFFASPSTKIAVPATMRLHRRVNKRWKPPRFRRKVLFSRDGYTCQYCGEGLSHGDITIDHVMPSSRGGQTEWLNCVSACRSCNKRKADRTPSEAEMRLLKKPSIPSALDFWNSNRSSSWHDDWDCYLPKP